MSRDSSDNKDINSHATDNGLVERYRAFINDSSEGIWCFELEEPIPTDLPTGEQIELAYKFGYLAECNNAMAAQYGFQSAAEVTGARLGDFLVRDDPNNYEFLKAFIESGYRLTDAESHERDVDGNDKYFLNSFVGQVEDEKLVRAWGTQRDITTSRQSLNAMSRLAAIVESSDDAIISKDLNGIITSFNKGAERIFGYTAEEVIGKSITILIPPERLHEETKILRIIASGKAVDHFETIRRRKDGTEINISLTVSPIRDADGRVIGASKTARDITERKRAARLVEENRMVLSMAMESSRMGAWEHEWETDIVQWTPELEEIFGLEPGSFPGSRSAYYELMDEADRERVWHEVESAVKERRPYAIEFRFRHADGSTRWMEGRGQAVYSDKGEPVRLYGIGIDITERKQAEAVLERYRLLSENARDIIWLVRPNGQIIEVNQAAVDTYGYSRDEFLTMNIGELRAEKMIPLLEEQLRKASTEGIFFETLHIRKDGTVFPVEVNASAGDFGGERLIQGIVRDITERKRAEDALREIEQRFSRFMHNLPGLAWIKDLQGRYIFVNDAAEKAFNKAKADLYGKNDDEIFSPETAAQFKENDQQALASDAGIQVVETLEDESGAIHHSVVSKFPIIGPDGKPAMLGGMAIDITEQKRAETALRESEERFAKAFNSSPLVFTITSLVDGRLVEVNDTFIEVTGYSREEAIGCNTLELGLWANIEDRNEELRQLTENGQVRNVEYTFRTRDGKEIIGLISAERIEIGGEPFALSVIEDITERKREELNRTLLFEIAEIIRQSDDAEDLMYRVVEAVGEHLHVQRCLFNEIDLDADSETVHHDYHGGVDSVAGVHKISDYSQSTTDEMASGKTVVNHDSETDERTAADYERTYKATGERAYVAVPLLRNGEWVASLWVSTDASRDWTLQEIGLLETVAERTWMAVERLRSEAALRKSEEQYRTLFDLVPVAVHTCDARGVIEGFNQNALTLWGREPRKGELFCGSLKIYYPDGRPMPHAQTPIARVLRGEDVPPEECEMLVERPDGARKVVIALPKLLRDEHQNITGAINCLYDVTDIKVAQRALIRAERKAAEEYQNLLQRIVPLGQTLGTARDLISIYRAVHEYVGSSMECCGFFVSFYSSRTKLRTAAYAWGEGEEIDISLLPPMPISPGGGSNSQAILNKKTVVTNRYWDMMKTRPHVVLQNNGIDPMSSLVVPMMIKNEVIGTLEVQAHEDEAFSREHIVTIEMVANLAAVAIENVRLLESQARARQEAEAANRTKDEFLSVLSHELRTPLNSMMGWIRMLRHGSLDAEHTVRALEVIDRNTRIQSSLIEDLLDVSRIISGKMRVEKELTDLSAAVRTAAEAIRPMAEAKNISFEIDTGTEPLFTDGDPVRLQQVATNLLQNSVKFTPEYGSVGVTVKRLGSNAMLEFRDSGIGIDEDLLPYIFERFRQGDASTKRGFAGLGLGLTIVRTIVELHGGKIKVESGGKERGTLFTVTMPLSEVLYAEELTADSDANGAAPESGLEGIKILLVDDDADSVRPLMLFLQSKKADVVATDSAAAALKELTDRRFDVLITDIGMPGTDGFELLTEMQKSTNNADGIPPAIAVTAYASPDDRERALASGFQAHLAKPVNYDELLAAVQQLHTKHFPDITAAVS